MQTDPSDTSLSRRQPFIEEVLSETRSGGAWVVHGSPLAVGTDVVPEDQFREMGKHPPEKWDDRHRLQSDTLKLLQFVRDAGFTVRSGDGFDCYARTAETSEIRFWVRKTQHDLFFAGGFMAARNADNNWQIFTLSTPTRSAESNSPQHMLPLPGGAIQQLARQDLVGNSTFELCTLKTLDAKLPYRWMAEGWEVRQVAGSLPDDFDFICKRDTERIRAWGKVDSSGAAVLMLIRKSL